MSWSWISSNGALIWQLTRQTIYLGVVSALIGLVISLPLGIAAAQWRWFNPPALTAVSVIYAFPAIALFIALIPSFVATCLFDKPSTRS